MSIRSRSSSNTPSALALPALLLLACSADVDPSAEPEDATPELASVSADPGYEVYPREFVDANGDSFVDYCRFVGAYPDGLFLSCKLGNPEGHVGDEYGFNSPPGVDPGDPALTRHFLDATGDGRADYCRHTGQGRNYCCLVANDFGFGADEYCPPDAGDSQKDVGFRTIDCSAAEDEVLVPAWIAMNGLRRGRAGETFASCVDAASLVEVACDDQLDRSRIIRAITENEFAEIHCTDLNKDAEPGDTILGRARVGIRGTRIMLDHQFILDSASNPTDVTATIVHEIMHNRGYTHRAFPFRSRFYGLTVPEQVEACVSTGHPNTPDPAYHDLRHECANPSPDGFWSCQGLYGPPPTGSCSYTSLLPAYCDENVWCTGGFHCIDNACIPPPIDVYGFGY